MRERKERIKRNSEVRQEGKRRDEVEVRAAIVDLNSQIYEQRNRREE